MVSNEEYFPMLVPWLPDADLSLRDLFLHIFGYIFGGLAWGIRLIISTGLHKGGEVVCSGDVHIVLMVCNDVERKELSEQPFQQLI